MAQPTGQKTGVKRRMRGFERASSLVANRVRAGSETRGFAVAKVLTHWAEIVGPEIARVSRPVDVKFGRGFGATLSVLTTGAEAPMLEMQKDRIRDRVNACYGYNAVQSVRITQIAPTGFADGKVVFGPEPKTVPKVPEVTPLVRETAAPIKDESLRAALERLGAHVETRTKHKKETRR